MRISDYPVAKRARCGPCQCRAVVEMIEAVLRVVVDGADATLSNARPAVTAVTVVRGYGMSGAGRGNAALAAEIAAFGYFDATPWRPEAV
jgi:hypothetical protein